MECIYIVLMCLIVLMHNSNALCSGKLLLAINLVTGVISLTAWEGVGGISTVHIYAVR